jgi:DNA (cytosine-5)-methyltransferase 1
MVAEQQPMIIDLFAGGGGASTGIELALGRSPDVAVNHDATALAMHARNHPGTLHLCESVYDVSPREVCRGRRVGLLWLSPDCKHFSKAKGGRPVEKGIRGLAWQAIRWSKDVRPDVIMLENVEEFVTWGPLGADGRPDQERKGVTFKSWRTRLRNLGYQVEHRELVAADYGAPTTRKRLFVVARCDGAPIVWPEPTHARPAVQTDLFSSALQPWRTAAECIDWTIPCPSIFERQRPLADNTLRRIAAGLRRYVIETAEPFIVPIHHYSLVAAHLTKFYGTNIGADLREPLPTITGGGQHIAEVRAFLISYYKQGVGQRAQDPLRTITTRDRLGLVTVAGLDYQIVDIGLRMLSPRELALAQGFPADYWLPSNKSDAVRMIGNSVCPPLAEALVRANLPQMALEAAA